MTALRRFLATAMLMLAACSLRAEDHAVVLLYHHVSDAAPASTSVSPETFDAHLAHLQRHGYTVWPLSRILRHVTDGKPLPENTVALTFDDAYRSVFEEVLPRMKARGWPFTIFVSTEYLDRPSSHYMSWEQLREALKHGAEVGNHSRSHAHLVRRLDGESEAQWRQRVKREITDAQQRLKAETGQNPRLFAYPYGEYERQVRDVVEELGFFGIAQQSGALGPSSDLLAVPRFPMAAGYAEMEKFASRIRSRPLPVEVLSSDGTVLEAGATPALQLRIGEGDFNAEGLACYGPGGRLPLEWLDREGRKVSVQVEKKLSPGRSKVNCTAPSRSENGVYYWYSHLWLVRNADGSWYRE